MKPSANPERSTQASLSLKSRGSTHRVSSRMLDREKKVSTKTTRSTWRRRRSSRTAFSCFTFYNSSTKQRAKSRILSARLSHTSASTLQSQRTHSSSTKTGLSDFMLKVFNSTKSVTSFTIVYSKSV